MNAPAAPTLTSETRSWSWGNAFAGSSGVILMACAIALVLHIVSAGLYGFHRDELYFFDLTHRLDWGYADHPPLIIALLKVWSAVFGASLFATHMLAGIVGVGAVALTGLLAREMGASKYGVAIACAASLLCPTLLATSSFLSTNLIEWVTWPLCTWLVLRMLNGGAQRLWLAFGAVAGASIQNKWTIVLFAFALIAGLLTTGHIAWLRQKWVWLGGLIALGIATPNLIWEMQHHWITIEVLQVANGPLRTALTPWEFFARQALMMHPFTAPLWIGGLLWMLFWKEARLLRPLGIAFVITYLVTEGMHGRAHYFAAAYPMLFAAGARARDLWILRKPQQRRWSVHAILAVYALGLMLGAPLSMPLIPPEWTYAYEQKVGILPPQPPHMVTGRLWPPLADMFAWPEMTATVARVYDALPPEERATATIYASNYGEAGAIDRFGLEHGLPRAISGHQTYYLWGPGAAQGRVVIIVGDQAYRITPHCRSVERVAMFSNPFTRPFENGPILVCRDLDRSWTELWPELKTWGQD